MTRRLNEVPAGFWHNPELLSALTARDVGTLFRALQDAGMSQRTIGSLAGLHQSRVFEIMQGARVLAIDALERIADGLAIPRERMGLGYSTRTVYATVYVTTDRATYITVGADSTSTQQPTPMMFTIGEWTGADIRKLRLASRMSVRAFAAHLGVSDRMVSKWEAGREAIKPKPVNQEALDVALKMAPADVQYRFALMQRGENPADTLEPLSTDDGQWLVHVPIEAVDFWAATEAAEKLVAAAGVPADGVTLSTAANQRTRHHIGAEANK